MADENFCHELPRIGYGQRTRKSCWYACYRLLYYWHHVEKNNDSKSHDEIAAEVKTRIERIPLDFDALISKGLHSDKFPTTARAMFLEGKNGDYTRNLSFGEFCQKVRARGPLWSAMIYENSPHIVVAAGYKSKTKEVYIFNPYNTGDDVGNVNVELRPYSWYQENIHLSQKSLQYW